MKKSADIKISPRYVNDNLESARAALYLAYSHLLAKVQANDDFENLEDAQYYSIHTSNAQRYFESQLYTSMTYDEFRIYRNRVEIASIHVDHDGRREKIHPSVLNIDSLTIQGFAALVEGVTTLL